MGDTVTDTLLYSILYNSVLFNSVKYRFEYSDDRCHYIFRSFAYLNFYLGPVILLCYWSNPFTWSASSGVIRMSMAARWRRGCGRISPKLGSDPDFGRQVFSKLHMDITALVWFYFTVTFVQFTYSTCCSFKEKNANVEPLGCCYSRNMFTCC